MLKYSSIYAVWAVFEKDSEGIQKPRKRAFSPSRNSFLIGFSRIVILRQVSITFGFEGKYANPLCPGIHPGPGSAPAV